MRRARSATSRDARARVRVLRCGSASTLDVTAFSPVRAPPLSPAGGDAFILEPVFAADLWPQHLAAPFSRLNEDEACGLGIELCTAAVTAMCGDAQADAAAAAASDGSRSARMAALRVGERAALLDSMRWLEEERALNGGKEYYQERRLRELNLNRPISDDEIVPA